MLFSWDSMPRPIVALAPIAGYTDSAYRRVVRSLTDGFVSFSELTSAAGLHYDHPEAYRLIDVYPDEGPVIVQLFGKEPGYFVESGKKLEAMGVAGIDINMGCPSTKVVANECGSALLRNPDLAAEIVHALSRAVAVPVSVKTRIGYSEYDAEKFFEFCRKVESAGASLLTLHGRTRMQGFTGSANWEAIYEAKRRLKIPVIGNGDVRSVADYFARLRGGGDAVCDRDEDRDGDDNRNCVKDSLLDGVMIGRATMGDPWLIAEIVAAVRGESFSRPKNIAEKIPVIRKHMNLAMEIYDERRGVKEMRKHLAVYIGGFRGSKEYVRRLMSCVAVQDAYLILDELEQSTEPYVTTE